MIDLDLAMLSGFIGKCFFQLASEDKAKVSHETLLFKNTLPCEVDGGKNIEREYYKRSRYFLLMSMNCVLGKRSLFP